MTKCTFDPTKEKGQPIGMFHCPECGEMVLAGVEHPDYDLLEENKNLSPVKCAAIKLKNDEIITGSNHGEIIKKLIIEKFSQYSQHKQGFITEAGEFLNRREAYERAVNCRQIKPIKGEPNVLSSDMLKK